MVCRNGVRGASLEMMSTGDICEAHRVGDILRIEPGQLVKDLLHNGSKECLIQCVQLGQRPHSVGKSLPQTQKFTISTGYQRAGMTM